MVSEDIFSYLKGEEIRDQYNAVICNQESMQELKWLLTVNVKVNLWGARYDLEFPDLCGNKQSVCLGHISFFTF